MKLYSKLLFVILMFLPLVYAEQPPAKLSSVIPLLPSNIPNLITDTKPDYAMGYAFSQDGRLFASFFSGKEGWDFGKRTNGSMYVWDTKTGKLKYKTDIPHYINYYHGSNHDIVFSPDDTMLVSSNASEGDILSWQFTKTKHTKVLCHVYDRAILDEVTQISVDNNIVLLENVNSATLCGTKPQLTWFYSEATGVLNKNHLLLIYNIKNYALFPTELLKNAKKNQRKGEKIIELWDMQHFYKNVNTRIRIDERNKLLIGFEILDGKIEISQWNYTNKKWLGKQSLTGLIKSDADVFLSDQYLLLHSSNNQLALFKRENLQYSLLWNKQLNLSGNVVLSFLSKDGGYILLRNITFDKNNKPTDHYILMDVQTGQFKNHFILNEDVESRPYTVLIEPSIESGKIISNYKSRQACANSKTTKTQFYSLISHKVIKEVDGLIVSLSPDGKMLAACKGSELFLIPMEK
jgi:hypothetical protein